MAPLFAHASRQRGSKGRRDLIATIVLGSGLILAVTLGTTSMKAVTETGRDWTGALVGAKAADTVPSTPAMSSASLVVPKSVLALPHAPPKPAVHVRATCDSADKLCVTRAASIAGPARRPAETVAALGPATLSPTKLEPANLAHPKVALADAAQAKVAAQPKGFWSGLNPVDHLPDLSVVGRPFAAAGHAVAGWVKWF